MAYPEDNYYGLMDGNVAGLPMGGLASIRTKYNGTVNPNTYNSAAYTGGAIDPTTAAIAAGNGSTAYVNPLLEVNNQAGLFGLTNGYWNNMGQAAGLAGTAYGLYDSILGQSAKKNKLQMEGLRQNIDFAKKANDSHYKFTGNIGKGFEGAFSGGGLAASAAQPKVG